MTGMMLIGISFVIIFRILIEKFCNRAEYKKRLFYVVGMMLCYTVVVVLMIYMTSDFMINQVSIVDFRNYICTIVAVFNVIIIFLVTVYCWNAKKRSLSNREKIKLKDL